VLLQDATNALKNSYTLNSNVFSLFLNIEWCRVISVTIKKTVPHTRSIDGKTTIAVVCLGAWDSQKTGTNGSKTTAGACWLSFTVGLQILRSRAVLTLVDQNGCLESDPLSDWHPVKISQDRHYVFWHPGSCDETSGSILDCLQLRVGYPWSLKVFEFKCCKIKALKVLENEVGHWNSLKSPGNV